MPSKFLYKLRNRFLKPYHTGYLPEKDGHEIYFQEAGNPKGIPVITFHGGPGGSAGISYAYSYNRKKYRIIMFDQRGCGLSKAKDPLYKNTIQDTVADAKRLLDFLGIKEKVVSAGCSFGSTCAILFAETYPEQVRMLLVNAIFLGRKQDAENLTPVAKYFYPDMLDDLYKVAKTKDLDAYFGKLILSNKKADNVKAMKYYKTFERVTGGTDLSYHFKDEEYTDKAIAKFKIFMHYQIHNAFLKDNQLLKNAKKIAHIPAQIYENRWDPCCPPYQAFELHQALPKSKLHMVPSQGHISDTMFWQMYVDNLNDYKEAK